MTKNMRHSSAHRYRGRTQRTTTDPEHGAEETDVNDTLERQYSVIALESVHHKGRFLGHVRRVLYHREPLPNDLDTLWGEQGRWQDEERWNAESGLGRKFFALCKQELFSLAEAEQVVEWISEYLRFLRNVTIQLIDDEFLKGEVPVRMVEWMPSGTVSNWELSPCCHPLGFGIGAFAEYGPHIRNGLLCPIGWYGWGCGNEMHDGKGKSEAVRTRPLGRVVRSES